MKIFKSNDKKYFSDFSKNLETFLAKYKNQFDKIEIDNFDWYYYWQHSDYWNNVVGKRGWNATRKKLGFYDTTHRFNLLEDWKRIFR